MGSIDKFGRRRMINGKAGLGFKKTPDGHYSMQNKRLTNVGEPVGETDVVTRKYLYKINENIIKALKYSIDMNSNDWLERFDRLENSMSKLEGCFREWYTTSEIRVEKISKQVNMDVK